MSYDASLPNYAAIRRTMGTLAGGPGFGYIPCPRPACTGTLRVVGDEMACDMCASVGSAPFPTTDRSS